MIVFLYNRKLQSEKHTETLSPYGTVASFLQRGKSRATTSNREFALFPPLTTATLLIDKDRQVLQIVSKRTCSFCGEYAWLQPILKDGCSQ
jgi:hypothetical protein